MQVKNVPEELHEAVRQRAADEGMTVSEYILSLIQRDLATPSQRQWLAQLEMRDPVTRAETVETLANVRAERDQLLDRR